MNSSERRQLNRGSCGSFRRPASTAFVMGLLAVTAACSPMYIIVPSLLIITPAIVDRSRERCAMCLLEGVLILFLVAMPLGALIGTMDTRASVPAVWHCIPSIQYFNPAFSVTNLSYQWCAMISFSAFTGYCLLRMAARLCHKSFRIAMMAGLAGTSVSSALFPLSWAATFPVRQPPVEETYAEYFLSHLMLGITWGTGGMVTAFVAAKLLHQKTEQKGDHPPAT